jgi:hypothetical protein
MYNIFYWQIAVYIKNASYKGENLPTSILFNNFSGVLQDISVLHFFLTEKYDSFLLKCKGT